MYELLNYVILAESLRIKNESFSQQSKMKKENIPKGEKSMSKQLTFCFYLSVQVQFKNEVNSN
jgi:hypothetical protein